MKKSMGLVLFIISVFVVSCSSDDDGGGTSGTVVGKWQFHQGGNKTPEGEVLFPYEHPCASKKDHIELLSSGVGKEYFYEEDCSLDYGEGSWRQNGDELFFSGDGRNDQYTILVLNESTLKVLGISSEVRDIIVVYKKI